MAEEDSRVPCRFARRIPYLLNTMPGPLYGRPLGLAHRGGDIARQNTMAAFTRAVDLGFRQLEIDVRTTACGTVVVFHDERLDLTTDAEGPVSSWTWEQLSQVRLGGEPLVRFEELLTSWDEVHLNVDLKEDAVVEPFVRLVEEHQAHDRILVTSFSDARRRRAQRLLSRPVASSAGVGGTAWWVLAGPAAGALGRVTGGASLRLLHRLAGEVECLQVPATCGRIPVVTQGFVERCHLAGLQVHVWTINDAEQMRELLALGVDGIVSDEVETLAAVLADHDSFPPRLSPSQ